MMTQYKDIQKERKIYYSQNGEDGVLEYILSKLNTNKWAVEFGAWDGKYLSNTYHFIEKYGYNAVLIEGDSAKMNDLKKNTEQFGEKVKCINAFVEPAGSNTLDNLLSTTTIPHDFDLLSIDIDGLDYFIWESLQKYQPKVVIIEINIKVKPGIKIIHDKNESEYKWGVSGSSIDAITELAHKKGYALIANVSCNAIFVKKEFLTKFFEKEPSTKEAYTYESFDLSELTLKEAMYKGMTHYLRKLVGYPFHLFRSTGK